MKLFELLKGVQYKDYGIDLNTEITAICYDSRKAQTGCAFFCIKGTADDGHNYIDQVRTAGAAVIIIEDESHKGERCISVPSTRKALSLMTANFYGNPSDKFKLIGVTGTNGKTTVTYLLKQILEKAGHKTGLIGTIQNMIGDEVLGSSYTTPEPTVLWELFSQMAEASCEYVVMEVSSHSLDQERVAGLRFAAGIFTNLTQDHLDYHITMENYLAAKCKLFLQSDIAVINIDDEAGEKLLSMIDCEKVTYSASNDYADVTAKDIVLGSREVQFTLSAKNLIERVSVGIPGKFSVYNALAVAAAALSLDIPAQSIVSGLATAKGVKGRAEVVPTEGSYTVLIDYAHTPDGLYNILKTVKDFAKGRVVVVFGCGGDRDKTKRSKMGRIAADLADFCVITSDNPRSEEPMDIINDILEGVTGTKTPYEVICDRRSAIKYAIQNARENDIIVLSGKGHEDYQVLSTGRIHFDEREIVAEIIKELKQ